MMNRLEQHLTQILRKLEKAQLEIRATQSYGKDERRLRMLYELVKEQVRNEDSNTSTRQIR